jgi:hypothetical protein
MLQYPQFCFQEPLRGQFLCKGGQVKLHFICLSVIPVNGFTFISSGLKLRLCVIDMNDLIFASSDIKPIPFDQVADEYGEDHRELDICAHL